MALQDMKTSDLIMVDEHGDVHRIIAGTSPSENDVARLQLVAAEHEAKRVILRMLADSDTDMVSAAAIRAKLGFKKSQLRPVLEVWPSSSYSP